MKSLTIAALMALLVACSPGGQGQPQSESAPPAEAVPDVPAGTYRLEKTHASLIFRVDHLGFSMYTARFKRFDAELVFDPAAPETSTVSATVDVSSLETDFPTPEIHDFNAALIGPQWLDSAQFPVMTFRSTSIERVGERGAKITGDFTMRGVTKPLVLDAVFNGGYRGHPMDPNARIGFSATGTLKRSDYGVSYAIPEPGTKMGVGDEVEIVLEVEFTGPPMTPETPPQP